MLWKYQRRRRQLINTSVFTLFLAKSISSEHTNVLVAIEEYLIEFLPFSYSFSNAIPQIVHKNTWMETRLLWQVILGLQSNENKHRPSPQLCRGHTEDSDSSQLLCLDAAPGIVTLCASDKSDMMACLPWWSRCIVMKHKDVVDVWMSTVTLPKTNDSNLFHTQKFALIVHFGNKENWFLYRHLVLTDALILWIGIGIQGEKIGSVHP